MPMESGDFNKLMNAFGADMEQISDKLHEAKEGRLTRTEVDDAVEAARTKLADYEQLLNDPRFNDLRRKQTVSRFQEEIDWLRDTLQVVAK
jgi:hypothetical protein